MNAIAFRTELLTDPSTLGYSSFLGADPVNMWRDASKTKYAKGPAPDANGKDDSLIPNIRGIITLVNAQLGGGSPTKKWQAVSSVDFWAAIDDAEFETLSVAQQNAILAILQAQDQIDLSRVAVRTKVQNTFGGASATVTALKVIAEVVATRADELVTAAVLDISPATSADVMAALRA